VRKGRFEAPGEFDDVVPKSVRHWIASPIKQRQRAD
jgi:hypothetical protein